MTTTTNRSPGCFRGYTNEQKTLRAKLEHLLKWTRDLKTNVMKQSCKVLQTNNSNNIIRQTIDQIHDDLDEYKRKFDRELGRIHDICDALAINQTTKDDSENLQNEILEALRRSPTYSSLEQHINDNTRPRIRVKPRERIHPGQNHTPRTCYLSTDTIKRKASQPIAVRVLDTASMSGTKRRSQVDAFRRSRSFTNIEHTETQLGMDYVEEDQSDLAWKPFGPKRTISQVSITSTNNEQSNDEQPPTTTTSSNITSQSTATMSSTTEKSKSPVGFDDNSSDEEFDVAWERRMKQKARKEVTITPAASTITAPAKRTVRFALSTTEPVDVIELDLDDETTQNRLQPTKDQNNNNNNKQQTTIVNIDDETTISETNTQSQITTSSITRPSSSSFQPINNQEDDSLIIDDSDDEVIALSDDDIPKKSRKLPWTSSEIQITTTNSQSQSLHNPYRVGIADPSLRSLFLPPPPPAQSSQNISTSNSGNRRNQSSNRKTASTKRTTNNK